ncbi:MAG: CPBP family intramembrane metalloprotease [Vicinamibacterales bacterium]|nr:CPBP family intramembrane metalloprotease [Vicinamibacterales bacterium]
MDFPPAPDPDSPYALTQARASAIYEIVLCSGVPSQLALAYMFSLAGFSPIGAGGTLSFAYIATLLLVDATLLIGLIFWFLRRHGEEPRAVFLGRQPIKQEMLLGLPMTGVVFILAVVVLSTAQRFFPTLHNVAENPLQQLIQSPAQALMLVLVATIGGGLREEIQRAFILHRFEQHLGGGRVGLILYSLIFGLGHSLQGWDAVLTTTLLGAFWGYVYLTRRSIVAPVVSHSGFNAAEIFVFLLRGPM